MQSDDILIPGVDVFQLECDFGFKLSISLRKSLRKFAQVYKKFCNV